MIHFLCADSRRCGWTAKFGCMWIYLDIRAKTAVVARDWFRALVGLCENRRPMPPVPMPPSALPPSPLPPPAAERKKRPAPGQRREEILQALAHMLEQPGHERITTAALASSLGLSEAALYRHFASKAKMFDALLDFIEQSVFGLVRQLLGDALPDMAASNPHGVQQARQVIALLLQFAERNPGLVRIMVGDAIALENPRLRARMQQFFDRLELRLRQCLRPAVSALGSPTPTVDANASANVLMSFAQGRLLRFVRSDFRRLPTEQLQASLALMV